MTGAGDVPAAVYGVLGALGGALVGGAAIVVAMYKLLPTRNECALRHKALDSDLETAKAQHASMQGALGDERTARETALRNEREDRHQLANDVQKVILPRLIAVETGQKAIVDRVGETNELVGKLFDKLDELRR